MNTEDDPSTEDEEFEREVAALRSNAEFMAFLAECEARGRTQPRKSLEEFRRELTRTHDSADFTEA